MALFDSQFIVLKQSEVISLDMERTEIEQFKVYNIDSWSHQRITVFSIDTAWKRTLFTNPLKQYNRRVMKTNMNVIDEWKIKKLRHCNNLLSVSNFIPI